MSWWYQGGGAALLLQPAEQVPLPETEYVEIQAEVVSVIPSGPGPAFR